MKIALPLQQHPIFAEALGRMGRDVRRIDVTDAAPVVAVRIFGQLLTSRGPVWDGPPNAAALRQSRLRLVNAETADSHALRHAGYRKIATAGSVAELDLTGTQEERLAATRGKWRNRWRRAMDAPVKLTQERFTYDRHRWLLDADHAQQKAKRFRSLPHELIFAIAAADPDAVRVHAIHRDDTPLAAMLFILHKPVVTYHLGWISDAGRQWGLHHRILMDAADYFAERGFTSFDLGAVDTENAANLARFKIGSGAGIRVLGGSWLRLGRGIG